jgi:hypothetical protein
MIGTEKQINWAEQIKSKMLAGIMEKITYNSDPAVEARGHSLEYDRENRLEQVAKNQAIYTTLNNCESAQWWIDNRNTWPLTLKRDLLEKYLVSAQEAK